MGRPVKRRKTVDIWIVQPGDEDVEARLRLERAPVAKVVQDHARSTRRTWFRPVGVIQPTCLDPAVSAFVSAFGDGDAHRGSMAHHRRRRLQVLPTSGPETASDIPEPSDG